MTDYSQPDFYRFNEDSLKLVEWVSMKVSKVSHLLDMGAGCGIIGIELANILKPDKLDLVEAQTDFYPHLQINTKTQLKHQIPVAVVNESFGKWSPEKKYDLITCNPPYYLPGRGEPSKDLRREVARSFVLDNWNIFFQKLDMAMTENGQAFLVVKDDSVILDTVRKSNHIFDLQVIEKSNLAFLKLSRLDKN